MTRRRLSTIMTKKHPQWDVFVLLLEEKLDFTKTHDDFTWDCDMTLSGARKILEFMSMDVEKSIEYFRKNGAYCDCEIIFNIAD